MVDNKVVSAAGVATEQGFVGNMNLDLIRGIVKVDDVKMKDQHS